MPERDHEFVEVAIEEFASGKPVPYAIYIRLSSWKYLQIASPGDGLDRERLNAYKDKNVRCLYLRKEDFSSYVNFKAVSAPVIIAEQVASPVVEAPVAAVDHVTAHRLSQLKSSAIGTLDLLKTNGINEILFEASKEFVSSTVSVLADDHAALLLLSALNQQKSSNFIYEHGLGVSLYSVMLGRVLGWKSAPNLFKVGLGGLLHDIGANSLDEAILRKPEGALTAEERHQLRQHPEWGSEILKRLTAVPVEVVTIVLQHHENESGSGYPKGLIGTAIHPLAKVVAVANDFCELVLDSPTSPRLVPQDAYSRLASLHVHAPDVLDALKRLLKGLPA